MKNLDEIIISEFSTKAVEEVIMKIDDRYTEILESFIPKERLTEFNETIAEYIIETSNAMFRQGFVRGMAVAMGGIDV